MPSISPVCTFETFVVFELGGVALTLLLAYFLHLLRDGFLHFFERVSGDDDLLMILIPFCGDLDELALHEFEVAG